MSKIHVAALIAVLMLGAAGCGAGSDAVQHWAEALLGGSLSSFAGLDGDDPGSRAIAREIATSRTYDFTPTGFTIQDGQVTATGLVSSDYGDGTGTLTITAGQAVVEMDVASNDPLVTDVHMTGTFTSTGAQQATDSPGSSFIVAWTVTWTMAGQDYSLTAEQTLTGTDWVDVV